MAHSLSFKVVIFLLSTFNGDCQAGKTENKIVSLIVNSANEVNRIFELFMGRQDFNQWFATMPWKLKQIADEEYDFIIVGSGSAGAVIANRLSEIKKWNILLLEAGIPETRIMGIPLFAPALQFSPYNWGYLMEYQRGNFFGLNGDTMHWPRGRALGGTSTINYMIYTRGNRWDYDLWAGNGNPGWSYEEVLPYFIKSERARNLADYDPRFHGENGYLAVENTYKSKLLDAFIESGPDVGLNLFDYNANVEPFGVSRIQATVKRGRRHSTATAFLWPVRQRKNLDIIIKAYVTKILINPITKEVFGVRYDKNGHTYTVKARKEVILSAGTFNSPQLLMLSGIGPKDHLNRLGVRVLANLPVGRNLQDHLTFPGITFEIDQPLDLFPAKYFPTSDQYLKTGTGPITSLGGVEGIGYIKTAMAEYLEDYPDMELLFVGGTLASDIGIATYRGMNIRDDVFDSIFRPLFDSHAWAIFPMLLHPKSIGYMELRSKNPYDYPRLFGNFFTDPQGHDLNTFLEAIRIIQKISNSTAFRRYGTRLNPRPMRGCAHLTFDSDDYWRCCLRSISVTLHHQVGTAKMGPPGDPTSVVNPNLQVYGIKNLRVSDCSIIPRALGAHTNAPAIMVGEKASDIIKEYWGELGPTSVWEHCSRCETDPQGHDLNTFLEAIRIIHKISNSTAFRRYGTRLNPRPMRGCAHLTFDSDDYWRCCLRSISVTLHHQVGTAKMGPPGDPTSVVNPNLQVYGIKNLRVSDCSIIPRALGAHTNAPAIMVGEKASDIIKEYWGELGST